MNNESRPNLNEREFLKLSYNKFLDLFDIIFDDSFWAKTSKERFPYIVQGFSLYAELLHYPPINWFNAHLKKYRPPMEGEIADELFRFVRNVIAHFPFFDSWDQVYVNQRIVNWESEGKFIDSFLKKHQGKPEVKYRFWEAKIKKMTYLSIKFPNDYTADKNIFVNDIFEEEAGVKFSFILMRHVLCSQIENGHVKPNDYIIMACVNNSRG